MYKFVSHNTLLALIFVLGVGGMIYSFFIDTPFSNSNNQNGLQSKKVKVVKITPNDIKEVSLLESFDLEFTDKVYPKTIKISVTPKTEMDISQTKNELAEKHLIIAPIQKYNPDTNYTITISSSGDKNPLLEEDYTFKFKTAQEDTTGVGVDVKPSGLKPFTPFKNNFFSLVNVSGESYDFELFGNKDESKMELAKWIIEKKINLNDIRLREKNTDTK